MHSPRDGGRTTGEQESIGRVIGQRDLAGLVDGPGPWRARLLVLILRVTLIAGVLVYLPSAYVALAKGLPSIALAATLALVVVLTLVLSPGVAFRWSATFYCLNFYVLGVALIVWFRPMSQIFLFAVTTFTTILLGLRVGFVSSILCTLTLLAMGLIGWAAPGVLWPGRSVDLTSWGVITLSFALVNMVVTLAIGVVLAMLDDALEREIGARVSLDRERTVLRTLIDTLPDIIFTKDRQGRYVIVNAATLAQADVAREADLIGKLDSDVFPRSEPTITWKATVVSSAARSCATSKCARFAPMAGQHGTSRPRCRSWTPPVPPQASSASAATSRTGNGRRPSAAICCPGSRSRSSACRLRT